MWCARVNARVSKQHCQPQLGSEVRAGAMGTLGCLLEALSAGERTQRNRGGGRTDQGSGRIPTVKCSRLNQHVQPWDMRLVKHPLCLSLIFFIKKRSDLLKVEYTTEHHVPMTHVQQLLRSCPALFICPHYLPKVPEANLRHLVVLPLRILF